VAWVRQSVLGRDYNLAVFFTREVASLREFMDATATIDIGRDLAHVGGGSSQDLGNSCGPGSE